MTSLIDPETLQHQLTVKPQVHTSSTDEGRAQKAELIDTGDDTGEQARLRAVVVLVIVDDLVEMNYSFYRLFVLAQEDREGRLWLCGIAGG